MKKIIIVVLFVLLGLAIFVIFENKDIILFQIKQLDIFKDEKIVVVIDPGHGGYDPGCVGKNLTYEKDIVLDISQELKNLLEEKGYEVYLTRDDDSFVSLKERAAFANSINADLFISIHMNSASVNGFSVDGMEIYYYDWSEINYKRDFSDFYKGYLFADFFYKLKADNKIIVVEESQIISETIRESAEENNIRFRKVAKDIYDVIAFTDMPSVIVECNFLSNPEIEELFMLDETIEFYSRVIFDGIDEYFSEK